MIKNCLKYSLAAFLLSIVVAGCTKEYEGIETEDEQNIQAYIRQNNLNVQQYDTTGIYYQVLTEGTGEEVDYTDIQPIVYTVRSLDNSYTALDSFSSNQRYGVTGQYGVTGEYLGYLKPDGLRIIIKEILKNSGGKIRVIIPSHKAYGKEGDSNLDIPGNATLDYTVNLIDTFKLSLYDEASIKQYLEKNNLTDFTRTTSGLYYKIGDPGTGSPITSDSTISVEYTGKLFNGTIFTQTPSAPPTSIFLKGFIKGWQEGIPLIKQGGSIRLIIPSSLAYGAEGSVEPSGRINVQTSSCLDYEIRVLGN